MGSRSFHWLALLTAVVLQISVCSAEPPGGLDLSWSDCGAYGQGLRNWACTGTTGKNVLIVSFQSPWPMPELIGASAVVDLQTNQATLSPFWQLQSGGCRSEAFSINSNFVSGPFSCADPWLGNAAVTYNYLYQYGGPNRARILMSCSVPEPTTSDGNSEYYAFQLVLTNAKSMGLDACAGCSDGVCFVLNSIQLMQPASLNANYTVVPPLIRNWAVWQSGGFISGMCPIVVPVRNSTWGSVKALYR